MIPEPAAEPAPEPEIDLPPVLDTRLNIDIPEEEEDEPAVYHRPAVPQREIPERPRPQARTSFSSPQVPEEPAEQERPTYHMIIEAATAQDCLDIAIDELKAIHREHGITNSVAKTSAEKLNRSGLSTAAIEKIRGKDFIIENAGELTPEVAAEVYRLLKTDDSGMIIVLADTPEGLDRLEDTCPEIFELCDLVSDFDEDGDEPEENAPAGKDGLDVPYADDLFGNDDDGYDDEDPHEERERRAYELDHEPKARPERLVRSAGSDVYGGRGKLPPIRHTKPSEDEMEIDDFAKYCTEYASRIDCSITGKSMLALYERIELMEEEGIPLTKSNAEDLIEEAADRAEKPPLFKRSPFKSKYDKNGLLILKEEDFIH